MRTQLECQNGSHALLIVGKLRLETRLTHEQLVPIAGISTRILQRIERGANASRKRLK